MQELRERCGLSKHGLARESGVSREYIGKIERGKANPTLPVTAQISYGLGNVPAKFSLQPSRQMFFDKLDELINALRG